MTQQPTTAAVEGEIAHSEAHHLTAGLDLDWVLDQIAGLDPIDVETWEPTDTDRAIRDTLSYLRDQILRRQAAQRGELADPQYCGVSRDGLTACGPDLGLPVCAWHGRTGRPGQLDQAEAALAEVRDWFTAPAPAPAPAEPADTTPAAGRAGAAEPEPETTPVDPAALAAQAVAEAAEAGHTGIRLRLHATAAYARTARVTMRDAAEMVDPAITRHTTEES